MPVGVPLDAYIPELQLAFMFPHKGTQAEENIQEVINHLCKKRGIICEHISAKTEPEEMCMAIKQGFAKAHIYIKTDSEEDIAIARALHERRKEQMRT